MPTARATDTWLLGVGLSVADEAQAKQWGLALESTVENGQQTVCDALLRGLGNQPSVPPRAAAADGGQVFGCSANATGARDEQRISDHRPDIAYAGGEPAAGAIVRAFGKHLPSLGARAEQRLGVDAIADDEGLYRIAFTEQDLRHDGIRRPDQAETDLFIRVFDEDAHRYLRGPPPTPCGKCAAALPR